MSKTLEQLLVEQQTLLHKLQTGYAILENKTPDITKFKHLRVGIDAGLANFEGLITLLETKGIATKEEMLEAANNATRLRVQDMEQELSKIMDASITLG